MISPDPIRQKTEAQLHHFIDALPAGPLDGKAVHQLRVLTKKWRAYLALYSAEQCPQAKVATAKLKRLADLHAGARDSAVLLKTLNRLIKSLSPTERERLTNWLLAGIDRENHPARPTTDKAVRQRLRQCLKDWPTASAGADVGINNLRAKAAKIGKKALKQDDDALYHRWRKWVKHQYYSLATQQLSPADKRYRRRLKKLGVALGRYHDLVMLEARLQQQPVTVEVAPLVDFTLTQIRCAKIRRKKRFSRAYNKLYAVD